MKTFISDISRESFPENQKISIESVRTGIVTLIKEDYPNVENVQHISIKELDKYRQKDIEKLFKNEFESLTSLETDVLDKLKKHELVSEDNEEEWAKTLTIGQQVADKVASFGGSWRFIIIFCVFIFFWIVANAIVLLFKPFDPYPFILLNLILSCLAALQAPVIMMSQNRVEEKDRQRAKEDYKINLKSEIEIQMLHEKVDHLIINQQSRLFEIQDIQVEMLKDITIEIEKLKDKEFNKQQKETRD